jgi:hypothetical protein
MCAVLGKSFISNYPYGRHLATHRTTVMSSGSVTRRCHRQDLPSGWTLHTWITCRFLSFSSSFFDLGLVIFSIKFSSVSALITKSSACTSSKNRSCLRDCVNASTPYVILNDFISSNWNYNSQHNENRNTQITLNII